jgi:hypothetical protein
MGNSGSDRRARSQLANRSSLWRLAHRRTRLHVEAVSTCSIDVRLLTLRVWFAR